VTSFRLRTLIVDDEPIARRRLSILFARLTGVEVVGEAMDGTDAVEKIRSLAPDVVLLDISMPGLDGMAVAVASAVSKRPPAIVFCTASAAHAAQAFDIAAVDYLLKPIDRERLERALGRARMQRNAVTPPTSPVWLDYLWIPHHGAMRRIEVAEIYRIDAEGDFLRLWTEKSNHLLHETLTRLGEGLDPTVFVRLRRSCIVRITLIVGLRHVGLGAWEAELAGGDRVRIGPTYWKPIKARLHEMKRSAV